MALILPVLLLFPAGFSYPPLLAATPSTLTGSIQPMLGGPSKTGVAPVGIADYGCTHPFNATGVYGRAVIYSLDLSPSGGGDLSVGLVGVLEAGSRYYLVGEALTFGGTFQGGWSYALTDYVFNVSSYPSRFGASGISGRGGLVRTANGTLYTFSVKGNSTLTAPFTFTPSINIYHVENGSKIVVQTSLRDLSSNKTLYQSILDNVSLAGQQAVLRVGGANPVDTNLVELVLGGLGGRTVNLYGVDGYLQLFYSVDGLVMPVGEAASRGSDILGGVGGVRVYPIYSGGSPLAVLSSGLVGFEALWPLNQSTITLSVHGGLTLTVNSTKVVVGGGVYQIPQFANQTFIENVLGFSGAQSVELYAPQYLQPRSGVRGVFLGWNSTYMANTLSVNGNATVSVGYRTQYLVVLDYVDSANSTVVGGVQVWVNASTLAAFKFPTYIYFGNSLRYRLLGVLGASGLLNASEIQVFVGKPTTLFGYYALQYIIRFTGGYESYYSSLDVWVNAFSHVSIVLPSYIKDGYHARLAFKNYTLGGTTYNTTLLSFVARSPTNITLHYVQQYEVNFTGYYSNYYYNLSGWYNEHQTFTISIPGLTNATSTLRLLYLYSVVNHTAINSTEITGLVDAPVTIQLVILPQYLVVVNAPNIHIDGFYNQDSVLNLKAKYYTGNFYNLYVFSEWVGTFNTTNPQLTITVRSPVFERAEYVHTYIRLALLLVLAATLAGSAIALALRHKSAREIAA